MSKRVIPRDPMTPVHFGWCYHRPLKPPTRCSWCDARVTVTLGGARLCPTCDAPDPSPTWEKTP